MLRERLRFARASFGADFTAGLTGAIAGAPQSMGFALLGGVNPVYGLYASIFPTIIGGLLSSSRFVTVAPTNVLMLLVAGALTTFSNPEPPVPLFTFTLLVAAFQLVFGLFRFSALTRFVSNAVVVGFISGAGVLIIFGQLDHIFGIEVHSGSNALGGVIELFGRIAETDPATLVIGVATTVMIYTFHHMRRLKNIATLVAFAVVTPMVLIFNWSTVALVRDQSPIPAGLPLPMLPDLGYAQPLLGAAFATALLACVQHAALVEKLRDRKEPRANINRDFVAHSISNAVGSVFQALPSSGSLSRTAVNISSGAQSRMANVYAGATIFLMMLLFSGVIEVIPLAALAGHLVVAALSLIDLRAIRMVWAVSAIARASMVATFAGALVLPLEYSIYGGVLLSLGLYIWSSSTRIEVIQLVQDERGRFSEQPCPAKLSDRTPVVLSVHGTLYFAAFRKLETLLPDPEGSIKPVVILRLRDTESLGSTGINVILRYDAALRDQGGKLILAGVGKKLRDELTRTGALMRIGPDAVFDAQPVIFQSTESATDYAAELSSSDADSA